LRRKFGAEIEVELIAGSGGIFDISADGRLVFSRKKQGRFPNPGEIVKLLGGNG
jgi:selenoprotein W-related protein